MRVKPNLGPTTSRYQRGRYRVKSLVALVTGGIIAHEVVMQSKTRSRLFRDSWPCIGCERPCRIHVHAQPQPQRYLVTRCFVWRHGQDEQQDGNSVLCIAKLYNPALHGFVPDASVAAQATRVGESGGVQTLLDRVRQVLGLADYSLFCLLIGGATPPRF